MSKRRSEYLEKNGLPAQLSSGRKYYQGFFKATNPEKYKGNPNNIVYRSQWEFRYMRELDHDPNVISWQSEEVVIPYRDPTTRRIRRYFPDFVVTKKVGSDIKTYVIEIKPASQCTPPKKGFGRRAQQKYLKEAVTFAVNQAKWQYAKDFCKRRGWEFVVLTEKELKIK